MYYYISAQGKKQDDVFPVSFKGHTVYMYTMLPKDCLSSLSFIEKLKLRTHGHQRFVLKCKNILPKFSIYITLEWHI